MVIDFSRLNGAQATPGGTRTNAAKDSVEAKAPALPAKARVAELKQAIADGSYQIDNDRLAGKIIKAER